MARILIVDDDETDRVLIMAVLEHHDHDLFFARDGRSALEVCRMDDIDLVVTDIAMPGLNGLRLIHELRGAGQRMPIIAASGVSAEQLDLAEDLGATLVLFKPIDPEKLSEAVRKALPPKRPPPTDLFGS